jgi:hypothetical protein
MSLSLAEQLAANKKKIADAKQQTAIKSTPLVPIEKKPVPSMASLLTEIYRHNPATWPNERYWTEYFDFIKSKNGSRDGSFNTLSMSEDMVRRLVTALSYAYKENVINQCVAKTFKLSQFMGLSEAFQFQIIDKIWDICTMAKTYSTALNAMEETTGDVEEKTTPLPSSLHPRTGGAGLPYVRGNVNIPTPFKTLGVGFRIDGEVKGGILESLARITTAGITAQVLNAAFMRTVRHMEVTGTTIALNTQAPRVYVESQDLFNETGVCVSRSLFGATAFPLRESVGSFGLWAVDVTGLLGFDTEKHQLAQSGNKNWRPGEKAYQSIPKNKVIGYVIIERSNDTAKGGWKFKIPQGSTWTFLGGSKDQQDYCTRELAAWASPTDYIVEGKYDFADEKVVQK